MKTIELTIGHNVNDRPRWNGYDVVHAVASYLNVEEFTAVPCMGVWHGQIEESTRIEICDLTDEIAETIISRVPDLSEALNQECIMVNVKDSAVEFVAPLETVA